MVPSYPRFGDASSQFASQRSQTQVGSGKEPLPQSKLQPPGEAQNPVVIAWQDFRRLPVPFALPHSTLPSGKEVVGKGNKQKLYRLNKYSFLYINYSQYSSFSKKAQSVCISSISIAEMYSKKINEHVNRNYY